MNAKPEPLRVHMREPEITEHEAAEAWRAVSEPVRGRAKQGAWWAVGLATLVASGVVLALLPDGSTKTSARPGVAAATPTVPPSSRPKASVLSDGSRLVAAPGSTLRTLESNSRRVRLRLESGSVDFDVVPNTERTLSVHAGDYEIIVVGTRFVVAFSESQGAAVAVNSGAVRVTRDGGLVALLQAGDSWSERRDASTTALPVNPARSNVERSAKPSGSESKPKDPAAELFDQASRARLAGKLREAAGLFDDVRKRYPGHALAGLAAFELGRLRLDNLGDAAGAAEAFGSSLTLAPSAPFREDVEARRVQALETLGSLDVCRSARAAYLSRYPNGPHAARVARRCEPK